VSDAPEASEANGTRRFDDVVRTVVYLAPGASWEQAAQAHRDVLGAVRPANTMLYVGALIGDGLGFLVEIEAQAVVVP
jgi:enamine deaminase RidA (YjgF/YER057c/UK114 family)